MISEFKKLDRELLSRLSSNNYSRRIKSHFAAYGVEYGFSRFFVIERNGDMLGLVSVFNSSMMISAFEGKSFGRDIIRELSGFIGMIRPETVELEKKFADELEPMLRGQYKGDRRTEFAFVPKNVLPPLEVDELPKLDDVFRILAACFPKLADSYELWLTDTSHRVRRGLSQSFLLGNYSTATIQYIVDGVALVGHVGTIPEERGKFHARQLLYWIGERLTQDCFEVRLFARPHRVSYYEEIGFKECGIDTVLERISTDE